MIEGRKIYREGERIKNEGCDGALGLGVRFRRCRFLSIMNHKGLLVGVWFRFDCHSI